MLISMVLTALTLIFPKLGFLEWISLIPFFLGVFIYCADEEKGLWRTYWCGFLTVFVYYFVVYHWFISLYPLDFIGMDNASSVVVVIAGWIGLSVLQALPGGLIFLIFKLLQRGGVFDRTPILRPIVLSALWIVFEWSSTFGWTGVPWGRLCIGQSEYLPVLQSVSLLGPYLISFLLLLVNGFLAYAILNYRTLGKALLSASLAAVLLLSNLLIGFGLMRKNDGERVTVKVAAIQGNVDMDAKGGALKELMRVYGDMTREAVAEGAQIVVWPESIFPYRMNRYTVLEDFVTELAAECKVTLIIGALYAGEDGNCYNTLYMVTPDGKLSDTLYHKRHLVPFGEYVPLRDLIRVIFPMLDQVSMLEEDVTAGDDSNLFDSKYGKVGALICFDSIYEPVVLDAVRDGAELIVIGTNDSWFFDSAGVYMHNAQARIRACETGRYIVRSANTGVSSIIDARGNILDIEPPLQEGYVTAEVTLRSARTLYSYVGNLFVYIAIALIAIPPVLCVYEKIRKIK